MKKRNQLYPALKTRVCFGPKQSKRSAAPLCFLLLLIILLTFGSCRKFIQAPAPVTTISSENVYTSTATAAAVLDGIYINMYSSNHFSLNTSLLTGLSSDELDVISLASPSLLQYYKNALTNQNGDFWGNIYGLIYNANSAITGISSSNSLPPAVKQQLLGEAQFTRAFLYFYLVNLYGPVPLALTTNPQSNATLSRATVTRVYQQIIIDLSAAQFELSQQFLDGTIQNPSTDRVRPSYWAATALLARVYLYYGYVSGDAGYFTKAVTQSSILIKNTSLFGLSSLNNVFLKASLGNNEAIWQLEPVQAGYPTNEALTYVLPPTGPNDGGITTVANPVWMSNSLLSAFEPGDQRRVNWVDSVITTGGTTYYFPYKYKNNVLNSTINEYTNVLRLGEQYLVRAEAEVQLNDIPDAQADLNTIRNRAGLPNTTAATQATLLTGILHERQVEFFTEMGHRWLDLKRMGAVNSVMGIVTPQKGGTWNANDALYPVPEGDLQTDPNLRQNPGY